MRHTALSVSRSELRTSLTASPSANLKIAIRLASLAGGFGLDLLGRLRRRDLDEIDAAAGRRFERLFLIGIDRRHPEFVDRVGHQQHLDPARPKAFELRAFFDDLEIVAVDRIDRVLSRPHRRDVFVERDEPVARRRAEPGERQQLIALFAVLV